MRSQSDSQRGSALVELITFGVATLMPVTLLLTGIFTLQRASFTAQSAVREATRAFVLAKSEGEAFGAAQSAARQVFLDEGIDPAKITITCSDAPCFSPSGTVRIAVHFPVSLMVKQWQIAAQHEERVNPWT